jgi:putative transposase
MGGAAIARRRSLIGQETSVTIWTRHTGNVGMRLDKGDVAENTADALGANTKEDTASPPAPTLLAKQARFEEFTLSFNGERPHQALGMKTPISMYSPSERAYTAKLDAITYQGRYIVRPIRRNGTIRFADTRRTSKSLSYILMRMHLCSQFTP